MEEYFVSSEIVGVSFNIILANKKKIRRNL
jgi:hypothetical protein